MIFCPVEVRRSTLHGLGLFALRPLRRGVVFSVWDPEVDITCDPRDVFALDEPTRTRCLHQGYIDRLGLFRIAAGAERYINHSEEPNLGGDPTRARIVIRDVAAGEELVEDYLVHEPGFTIEG